MSSLPDTWKAQRGSWIDKRGTLVVNQSDQTAQLLYGSTGWQTQNIKATVLWSAGAAGLIMRYDNTSNQYISLAAYPQSSILAIEYVNAAFNRSTLTSYSGLIGISIAQDFEMVADCNGSNYRGWVNGIQYLSTTNTALSAGQVGLEYQAGIGQFRDVHVRINQPDGNLSPVTLPTDFGAYCSVDDVKSLLQGIPLADIATDDDIYMYIKEGSDMINRATYSSFGTGTRVTERYDGTGQYTLVLNHSPIIKLHLLKLFNFNNVAIRTWSPGKESSTTDDSEDLNALILEKNYGFITIPPSTTTPTLIPTTSVLYPAVNPLSPSQSVGTEYDYVNRFGRGVRNILVNYTYGFETVPERIRWAVAKTVGALLLIKRGNKDTGGAVELQMEGLTVNFMHRQGMSAPYGGIIEQWATDVQNAIKDYSRVPPAIL